jgi:hypothetical protein
MSNNQMPMTKPRSGIESEPVLVLVERKSLTPWGVRCETTWVNAMPKAESYVVYVALQPLSPIRMLIVRALSKLFRDHELLVRWLLSLVVDPTDAKYAFTVVDSYGVTVPLYDDDDEA